jgi:hypothetical protein
LEKDFRSARKDEGEKHLFMKMGVKTLIVGLAVAGFANWAHAAATLSLYDGANPLISLVDNGSGDLNGSVGQMLVITNVGVWNLTITSAVTKPALGSATNPVMDIAIQAISTASGSLTYTFSDNGFGPATGTLNATVSGHVISGTAATVGYDVWGDSANVLGAETVHLAGTGTSPMPVVASNSGPLTLPTPFSLTQVVELNASGASDISIDASFNVVPEPSTIGLVVVGLLGMLGIRRRKA